MVLGKMVNVFAGSAVVTSLDVLTWVGGIVFGGWLVTHLMSCRVQCNQSSVS